MNRAVRRRWERSAANQRIDADVADKEAQLAVAVEPEPVETPWVSWSPTEAPRVRIAHSLTRQDNEGFETTSTCKAGVTLIDPCELLAGKPVECDPAAYFVK